MGRGHPAHTRFTWGLRFLRGLIGVVVLLLVGCSTPGGGGPPVIRLPEAVRLPPLEPVPVDLDPRRDPLRPLEIYEP